MTIYSKTFNTLEEAMDFEESSHAKYSTIDILSFIGLTIRWIRVD